MESQSYNSHIRYYAPHHFVYYPILSLVIILSTYFSFTQADTLIWIFISIAFIFLFALAFMLRQHYALTLQNRIVRLELRYRYFTVTGKRFENLESQMKDAQLFALRFASDQELESLIDRAVKENLSGTQIKKAIANWKGDYNRV